jgi:hypothetical protein
MTVETRPTVDVNVPRFNQAMVAILTAVGFVTGWWGFVIAAWAGVALNRFAGPRFGPFTQIYVRAIRPRLLTSPDTEWSLPPRFSQLLAFLFLGTAGILFAVGLEAAGWFITLAVTALATLAATARICVGCLLYEWMTTR